MALINCPECNNPVSTGAKACPHCGYKVNKKPTGRSPLFYVFVGLLGMFFIAGIVNAIYKDTGHPEKSPFRSGADVSSEWYVGGTLHVATVAEWKTASEKNKLATCGDFMAGLDKDISMEDLKIRAKSLVICIDAAVKDQKYTDGQGVAWIATLCIVSLGYK